VFNALFSIETENWDSTNVTMTALAVGDATPSILALTALTEVEVGADAELADQVAPSAAFGGEQPTTMQDSAKPVMTNAIRILGSIDAIPDSVMLCAQTDPRLRQVKLFWLCAYERCNLN
jgi:hypothetical protein